MKAIASAAHDRVEHLRAFLYYSDSMDLSVAMADVKKVKTLGRVTHVKVDRLDTNTDTDVLWLRDIQRSDFGAYPPKYFTVGAEWLDTLDGDMGVSLLNLRGLRRTYAAPEGLRLLPLYERRQRVPYRLLPFTPLGVQCF